MWHRRARNFLLHQRPHWLEANGAADEAAADNSAVTAPLGAGVFVSKTGVDSLDKDGRVTDDSSDADSKELDVDPGVVTRAFKINKAETWLMVLGCIDASMSGASWPISALVFSEVVAILQEDDNESEILFWCLMYVAVGVMSLTGNVLRSGMLGVSGERMTRKLRAQSFRAMLRQEIGFFDRAENSVGALTTRLATDSSYVKIYEVINLGFMSLLVQRLSLDWAYPLRAAGASR